LNCALYDAKANLIKTLSRCQILPNEVNPGVFYTIRYSYVPNPYQTAIRDIINVTTIA